MTFEKGHSKLGGRKVGTPNKASIAAKDKLEAIGFDPLEFMARIALDDTAELPLRLNAAKELAQYVCPKLKSSELKVSSEVEPLGFEMSDEEAALKMWSFIFSQIKINPKVLNRVHDDLKGV